MYPRELAVDDSGVVYVCYQNNNHIQIFLFLVGLETACTTYNFF